MEKFNSIYSFLKSVQFAVTLVIILIILCLAGGLIPQNSPYEVYFDAYGKTGAELITKWNLDHIFSSILFLIPAGLFIFNLSLCTWSRFTSQITRKNKKRFGPDVMHFGLLLFAIGAVISVSQRFEQSISIEKGKMGIFDNNMTVYLHDTKYEKWEDGRPASWESLISVDVDGIEKITNRTTGVNKPLRLGTSAFYQQGYEEIQCLLVESTVNPELVWLLRPGEEIFTQKENLIFMMSHTDEEKTIAHIVYGDSKERKVYEAMTNEGFGSFKIQGFQTLINSTITIVTDPGYWLVLLGMILGGGGTLWLYIQKLLDALQEDKK
jgi:hypothetical protein